jgi:hypothetical protein
MIDSISPIYVGSDKIVVTLDENSSRLAFSPVTVNFDYSAALPADIVLPLEVVVQPAFSPGGDGGGFRSKTFRKNRPTSYTFNPPAAGTYLIVIRELFHNQWQGRFEVVIAGDEFSTANTERVI